jgi:hypothetical protein
MPVLKIGFMVKWFYNKKTEKEPMPMAVLISGDFHANAVNELGRITKEALVSTYGHNLFDEIRYHVILGDGGFMWPGNEKGDIYNYKVLVQRPDQDYFRTAC